MSRKNDLLPVKFDETLRRWSLLKAGETCVVAVSGGVDSMVLLHLLLHLHRPEKKRPKVVVAHFNHGLRKNSVREEAFIKKICREWKVPCRIGRARGKIKNNVESRARDLRYAFLEKVAREVKSEKILTAHHADDQVETFLIRWLQGAGLKGLSGISLQRPWAKGLSLVRPMLLCSRSGIESYARSHGIVHIVDESNDSPKFLRNRVRRLAKALKKENPNLPERAAINSLFLKADEAFLDRVTGDVFRRIVATNRSSYKITVAAYRLLEPAVRYRLLQRMARHACGQDHFSLSAAAILKLDDIGMGANERADYGLSSGLGFRKRKGSLEISMLKSLGKPIAPRKSAC